MTVSSRRWRIAALVGAFGLGVAGVVVLLGEGRTGPDRPEPACTPAVPLVVEPRRVAERAPEAASTPLARAGERPEQVKPIIVGAPPPPPVGAAELADPEEQLIAGNVDLATRAIQLARLRASGDPGLTEAQHEYELAAAKQSERAREAGYGSPDAN